jgi:phosphate/sulfate permease
MIDTVWLVIAGASATAFYMAWSIGANDVANAIGPIAGIISR